MKHLVLATAALAAMFSTAAHAQTAQTSGGTVEGSTQNGVTSFLSIPYAAPPTGENRWRAPQPLVAWDGVRDATQFRADCASEQREPNLLPGLTAPKLEDCLYANIWVPEGAEAGDNLPVMFWVHGGGLVDGGTSTPVYSGEAFARNGVIMVSINYRLARLGFFAHPGLKDEGVGGNFGWLDQIAALKWVNENIAGFGGNPDDVTIFGESAGGRSIHMLLQAPAARGMFARAIIQSGGSRERNPIPTIAEAAIIGDRVAPGASAEQLRAIPVDDLIGLQPGDRGENGNYSGPMRDGVTDIGEALTSARAGLYPDVPIIIGANSADVTGSSPLDKDAIFAAFGDRADEARALYDPDGSDTGLKVGTQVASDWGQVEPARAIARALAAHGNDVYLFRFAHNGTTSGVDMGGAPHASEIPYVFDQEDIRLQPLNTGAEAQVADTMHGYWVNFAKTGDPNGNGLPAWPKATADTTSVQMIATEGTSHVEDPRTAMLDFRERLADGS